MICLVGVPPLDLLWFLFMVSDSLPLVIKTQVHVGLVRARRTAGPRFYFFPCVRYCTHDPRFFLTAPRRLNIDVAFTLYFSPCGCSLFVSFSLLLPLEVVRGLPEQPFRRPPPEGHGGSAAGRLASADRRRHFSELPVFGERYSSICAPVAWAVSTQENIRN